MRGEAASQAADVSLAAVTQPDPLAGLAQPINTGQQQAAGLPDALGSTAALPAAEAEPEGGGPQARAGKHPGVQLPGQPGASSQDDELPNTERPSAKGQRAHQQPQQQQQPLQQQQQQDEPTPVPHTLRAGQRRGSVQQQARKLVPQQLQPAGALDVLPAGQAGGLQTLPQQVHMRMLSCRHSTLGAEPRPLCALAALP